MTLSKAVSFRIETPVPGIGGGAVRAVFAGWRWGARACIIRAEDESEP